MKAPSLRTVRLTLEPLTRDNAERLAVELEPVLADPALYRFIGGDPPTAADLVERHRRWAPGTSPDMRDWWLNWAVRRTDDGVAVGTVQATGPRPAPTPGPSRSAAGVAWGATGAALGAPAVAWVVGVEFQRRGYAVEASSCMLGWLCDEGAEAVVAWIHPDNIASQAVAARLGMRRTDAVLDGEIGWLLRLRPDRD